MKAMLSWYRALLRRPPSAPSVRITVPSLLVWGAKDKHLLRGLATRTMELCDEGRLVVGEDSTHWIPQESPDLVSSLLTDFLKR
jgi:pimeloyl-ACP methyl ester carboxylesterase